MAEFALQNMLYILAAIVSAIILISATFVSKRWIFNILRPGGLFRLVALIQYLQGKHRSECLPPSSLLDAIEAAEQRRRFLSEYLGIRDPTEFPRDPTEFPRDPTEFPRLEIRERPPETETIESTSEFSPGDAVGQMVRIMWQFERPELLLLERVVDAALAIVSRLDEAEPRVSGELLGAIRLVPIARRRQKPDLFPWTVVLETHYPEIFRPHFERLRRWLSIGIDFDKPHEFVRYGFCQVPGGEIGEVGGLIDTQEDIYSMTCAHVLSDRCNSVVVRGIPTSQGQQPDAALLVMKNPCFREALSRHPAKVVPASRYDIERCYLKEDTVRYGNLNHKRVRGYLNGAVSAFPIDGVIYRFPHEAVVPKMRLILGFFPWPPGSGRFSGKGDSGSWVVTENSNRWVGLLVGGDPLTRVSYVAEGSSLLEFFRLELTRQRRMLGQITSLALT